MASRKLTVDLVGNNRNLRSTLDNTESRMGRFQGRARSFGVGVAAGVASAFAVDKILGFAGTLATLGTSIEVAGIKADTVFGNMADDVRAWADDLNEDLGLSDEALTGLAANMGDLLKPMGFTTEEAANMSMEMLDLAGALSAWSGGQRSAAEVSDILAKAMLGERESLKELGISISQAEIDARVMENTTGDLTDAQLAQAEATAAQQLILEKSTDAQAAWNDGSMDSIKAQNELKAAWADAQVFLAQHFLPVLRQLFEYGRNVIDFAKVLKLAWDINGFQGVMDVLGRWFSNTLMPQLKIWFESIRTWVVESGAPMLKEGLTVLGSAFWSWLQDTAIPRTGEMFGKAIAKFTEWVQNDGVSKMVDTVRPWVDSFWSWLTHPTDGVIAKIPPMFERFLTGIANWISGEGKEGTEGSGGSFAAAWLAGLSQILLASLDFTFRQLPLAILNAVVNGLPNALNGFRAIGHAIGGEILAGAASILPDWMIGPLGGLAGSFGAVGVGGMTVNPTLGKDLGKTGVRSVSPMSMSSGPQITINAGMGTDPVKLGGEIRSILDDYERRGGR